MLMRLVSGVLSSCYTYGALAGQDLGISQFGLLTRRSYAAYYVVGQQCLKSQVLLHNADSHVVSLGVGEE